MAGPNLERGGGGRLSAGATVSLRGLLSGGRAAQWLSARGLYLAMVLLKVPAGCGSVPSSAPLSGGDRPGRQGERLRCLFSGCFSGLLVAGCLILAQ